MSQQTRLKTTTVTVPPGEGCYDSSDLRRALCLAVESRDCWEQPRTPVYRRIEKSLPAKRPQSPRQAATPSRGAPCHNPRKSNSLGHRKKHKLLINKPTTGRNTTVTCGLSARSFHYRVSADNNRLCWSRSAKQTPPLLVSYKGPPLCLPCGPSRSPS